MAQRFVTKTYITAIFLLSVITYKGFSQEVPYRPVSYRIFNQEIINPAINGMNNIPSISFISTFNRFSDAQILSGSTRLGGKTPQGNGLKILNYGRLGTGGYLFNDFKDSIRYLGFGAGAAYHMPVSRDGIQYVAGGISVNGVYTKDQAVFTSNDSTTSTKSFVPNINAGIYYYGAHASAGLSITNILNSNTSSDSSALGYNISTHYFFTAGYKFILSKKYEFVLEPFLLAETNSSGFNNLQDHIHPGFKLYYKHSYVGTYINNFDNFSLFMHLQFPRIFVGTYLEFPWNGDIAWHYRKMSIEFSIGINFPPGRTHQEAFDAINYF